MTSSSTLLSRRLRKTIRSQIKNGRRETSATRRPESNPENDRLGFNRPPIGSIVVPFWVFSMGF